jgi:hypothetical protein
VLVAGSIPEKKAHAVAAFLPEGERPIVVLDFTTFGSAKDAAVFTDRLLVTHDIGEKRIVELRYIAACAGATGMLADKVALTTFSGATIHVPCGGHAELMTELVGLVARLNRGG